MRAGYLVTRIVLVWLLTAGTLFLLSAILPGFHVTDPGSALVTAAFIGLANALVWPTLVRIALPFTVLTLGLGALVLNGLVVAGDAAIEPGVTLDRFFDGVLVAIGLTAVNTIFTTLFAIDDEDFWYSHAARRQARRTGVHETDVPDDHVEGEDPLAPYGPNAPAHVRRTDAFPHCPDIVVNSTFWEDLDEVAAFEELVGSHGGMGGEQSFPFLLYPHAWEAPDEHLVGAEAVHRRFRSWLVALGHEAYR
jgi:uncharacterized membrane protein YvlD (DUF360 family)